MKSSLAVKKSLKSKEFTLLLLIAIVIIFFTILSKGAYVKALNIRNILNSMVIVSFLAVGEGLLIIYGNIDLSSGNSGTMCAIIMALGIANWGLPWYVALILTFAVGMLVGVINATLIVRLNFQPFIATLAVSSVTEGLSNVLGNASAIQFDNEVLSFIGNYRFANKLIPFSVIIALLVIVIYGFILAKTKFGRMIYLCGGNKEASRLAGINPKKVCYILFMNMGFLAAMSGCMLAARMKAATVNGISSNQFSGVTAAILGGISFGGGSGTMFGAFLGLLLLNCFNNGMIIVNLNPYWHTVASGALMLFALIVDYFSNKRKLR